jgi:1-acyl-sn-glycerol-3-phosphate acyltransferase
MERIRKLRDLSVGKAKEFTVDAFLTSVDCGYRFEVNGLHNLDVLRNEPNAPVFMVFNHTKRVDPFAAAWLIKLTARERMNNVIAPVSDEYTKFRKFTAYASAVAVGRWVGFNLPEIMQAYRHRDDRLDKNDKKELKKRAANLSREFMTIFRDSLEVSIENAINAPVCIISPEGTRSDYGSLLPPEAGGGSIVKELAKYTKRGYLNKAYVSYLGIDFQQQFPKQGYNPYYGPTVVLNIGEVEAVEKVIENAVRLTDEYRPSKILRFTDISNYLMYKLSLLLPEQRKGVCHEEMLADTLAHRYEQRLTEDGVRIYDKYKKIYIPL